MQSQIYRQSLSVAWPARTSAGGRQRAAGAAAASGTRGTPVVASSSLLLPADTLGEAKLLYATAGAPAHDYPGHAECAERVPAILRALQAGGLTEEARPGQLVELTGFAPAERAAITAVHSDKYVATLEKLSAHSADCGETRIVESSPTYLTGTTSRDASRAAGAVIALVDHVVAASRQREAAAAASGQGVGGGVPAGFAICRPPGHHSLPSGAMGFCIFGNVSIAARYAQKQYGLQRVLIFDWDVHHGNGTQDVFESDPDVLFISTHQANAYPGTGKAGEVGVGDGEGATINVPLPGGAGHEAILAAWEEVVEPAARRFRPDIILVSAGYDAHWADPLAGLQFCSATFHALGARVKALADDLCGGRLVFLLEGGYDLEALGQSVANTFLGVLGEAPSDSFDRKLLEEPLEKVQQVLQEARRIHGL